MKCPNCGAEMSEGVMSCSNCGCVICTDAKFSGVKLNQNKLSRENLWYYTLKGVMQMPGVKVDRMNFLEEAFKKHYADEKLAALIKDGTVAAEISMEAMDKVADEVIERHKMLASGASFLAGLPGGLALVGTIPADAIQYYFHALQIVQKLAYIYGYPNLDTGGDDEFVLNATVLMGVMSGTTGGAAVALSTLAHRIADMAAEKTFEDDFAKKAYYPIVKQTARALGARLSREIIAKGVGKIIPIVGGVISGGVTWIFFTSESERFKEEMRKNTQMRLAARGTNRR